VGLVAFARIARRVTEAVVPAYKSRYSKRVFVHPAATASGPVSDALRGLTFREAEIRLAEHAQMRTDFPKARYSQRALARASSQPSSAGFRHGHPDDGSKRGAAKLCCRD
jgi:hypothetical protein